MNGGESVQFDELLPPLRIGFIPEEDPDYRSINDDAPDTAETREQTHL